MIVQSHRVCAVFIVDNFRIVSREPLGLSGSLLLELLTTEVAGSEESSGERRPKWLATKQQRSRTTKVSEMAVLHARAPARRECGREFPVLGPAAQKERFACNVQFSLICQAHGNFSWWETIETLAHVWATIILCHFCDHSSRLATKGNVLS